ncbi:MAG: FecR domain-containing protein [Gemmatimonadaceae bacterium]
MSDTFDWRIIDREVAGEASSADHDALRRWLAEDPRHEQLLLAMRAAAGSSDAMSRQRWNVDAAWSRVASRMDDIGVVRPLALHSARRVQRSTSRRAVFRRVGVAAGALAAASLIALVGRGSITRASRAVTPSAMHEVVAAKGQQTRITLHDGTRVVLNAGSRLRYTEGPGRPTRDVELDGEGYFDVVHDAARPFRVHARGNVAEDLGTRFVVRAYQDSRHVEVVVEEGRVSLRRDSVPDAAELLGPGQLGRVELDGTVTVVDSADVDRWLSWTRGALVLDGLSLAEAANEIGRRFDAHVEVGDSTLATRRISARFRDESLPRVLDALAMAVGARWTRDGQRIVITKAGR